MPLSITAAPGLKRLSLTTVFGYSDPRIDPRLIHLETEYGYNLDGREIGYLTIVGTQFWPDSWGPCITGLLVGVADRLLTLMSRT